MSLSALLEARIAREGPITLAEFMEAALTHTEFGYYIKRDPLGAGGDFTTAPEISQLFGEMLGAWLADAWRQAGAPSPFLLLELGPGRGTLMNDALRATRNVEGFHQGLRLFLYEASPALQQAQRLTLSKYSISIQWLERVSQLTDFIISQSTDLPLFFLANEFFDALPIRQFIERDGVREERRVDCRSGAFCFTHEPENLAIRESCEPAGEILSLLASYIARRGGAGLVADYGYSGGSRGDTLQAVRHHAYADPLKNPGEADLTAHVDFDALAAAARKAGAKTHGPAAQGAFLQRLGIELRAAALMRNANPAQAEALMSGMQRLIHPAQMGRLFKILAVTHPALDQPAGFD